MAKTVTILLVEDDPVDVEAVKRAFHKLNITNPIVNAPDGVAALELLRNESGDARIPRPFLMLVDLNMPRMGGLELIKELRADSALQDSVVFVLTTSKHDEDRAAAYGLNVCGYVHKSNVGNSFLNLVEMLDRYWRVVEFP